MGTINAASYLLLEKSWPDSTGNSSKCSGEPVTVFGGTVQCFLSIIQFSSHDNLRASNYFLVMSEKLRVKKLAPGYSDVHAGRLRRKD